MLDGLFLKRLAGAASLLEQLLECALAVLIVARGLMQRLERCGAKAPRGLKPAPHLHVSFSPRVSGKRKISAPPAAKNTDVNASALPMPKRSAKAPMVKGASALAARPTL